MTVPDTKPEPSVAEQFDALTTQIQQLTNFFPQLVARASERDLPEATSLPKLIESAQQALTNAQAQAHQLSIRREQLQELVHTSALLTSSLELDQVLEEVMETVIRLVGAERVYLMLRDESSGELNVRAARSKANETIRDEEVNFSRGLAKHTIEQGTPVITTNADMSQYTQINATMGLTMRSVICIPLHLRGTTTGALYADKKIKLGLFTPESIPMLTAFANQAAIAIENARLFAQTRAELVEAQQQARQIIIQIDEKKTSRHLDDIINSEFFKKLRDSTSGDPGAGG